VTNFTYNHSINIIEIPPAGAKMDNCLKGDLSLLPLKEQENSEINLYKSNSS
jgi:hypothetical protein